MQLGKVPFLQMLFLENEERPSEKKLQGNVFHFFADVIFLYMLCLKNKEKPSEKNTGQYLSTEIKATCKKFSYI